MLFLVGFVQAKEIPVPDAGFEDTAARAPSVDGGFGQYIYLEDEAYTGPWQGPNFAAYINATYYPWGLPAHSGNHKVTASDYYGNTAYFDVVYQILDETFIEGATYTLSVWVGNPRPEQGDVDDWSLYFTGEDYTINLAEAHGLALLPGWEQISLEYTATAADAGKKIGIKISGAEGESYVAFDDVTLSYGFTIAVDPGSDIAAANAQAEAGDTVLFAEGMYYLSSQINVKSGVTYQGAGAGLTILDCNNLTRAFVAWGDRGATSGQVDANGIAIANRTGPTDWVISDLTIQNGEADALFRVDILSSARDLLNNYTGTPYTLDTAQTENSGIRNFPEWFDILGGAAPAGNNLTMNPSFESPDLGAGGTGQWADHVDNWIINSQGNSYLEDGTWQIVAPEGIATLKIWSGGAIWQQIGNVSPNTDYDISMFIGRGNDAAAVQVELWGGGDPAALPASFGMIGDTVGATRITGDLLAPTVAVGQNELMSLSLNSGAAFSPDDALWIRIESIVPGGSAVWLDNVMVATAPGTVENLTDAALQAYLDANPVGSAGHLVERNEKWNDAGALALINGASGTLRDCALINCHAADDGGATSLTGACTLNVSNCSFTGMTAGDDGGACIASSGSTINVSDSSFADCSCGDDAGVFRTTGASTLMVDGCLIIDSLAGDRGGAAYAGSTGDSLSLTNCVFDNVDADDDGAVVYVAASGSAGLSMANCLVMNCDAPDDGVVNFRGQSSAVLNCTFVMNSCGDKGIIHNATNEDNIGGLNTIVNNIFYGNTNGGGDDLLSQSRSFTDFPIVTTNNLFMGNIIASGDFGLGVVIGIDGNVQANPLFVSLTDFHIASADSLAVDGGTDVALTKDLDGNVRPQGNASDIGAYESAFQR